MEPRIEHIEGKKIVGMRASMFFAENTTSQLWRTFMPRRHEVKNRSTSDYISMQIYDGFEGGIFSPAKIFEKWAAVEVSSFDAIPEGMERYTLSGGKYAVFIHRGPASAAPRTMKYIFGRWLPEFGYELDDREHFEVLPSDYNPLDADAQEEVWIPVK